MSDVIPAGDGAPKDLVLGDDSSQQALSFKLAQAFYNEITGRSERIVEEFNPSFILNIANINQLHHLIVQSTAQYNVCTANASFSVEYINDSSERYSSIERFNAHAPVKGIAVEEVDISYRLLVVLPQTQKPQEYRINVRLMSRVAKVEKMKKELEDTPFSFPFWQLENKFTCRVSIDFVDVTVAHAFMAVVKSWINCLEVIPPGKIIRYIRPYSKHFPFLSKYALLTVAAFLTTKSAANVFQNELPETTALFVLYAFLFNFMFFNLGRYFGQKADRFLDQTYNPSYINFSGADSLLSRESSSAMQAK